MVQYDPTVALDNLKKLRANIYTWAIQSFIDDLREKWNPKMIYSDGTAYNGPNTPEPENVLYRDESTGNWTIRDTAFRSFVFRHIKEKYR